MPRGDEGRRSSKNTSLINDVPMDLPKVYGDYERLCRFFRICFQMQSSFLRKILW